MALLANALLTLAHAKELLGIADDDTSQDAFLESSINKVSSKIESLLNRKLGRAEHSEILAPTGRQYLCLQNWPIVGVSSFTDEGAPLVVDVDYRLDPQDKAAGLLYRDRGWWGPSIVRGLTSDLVAYKRTLAITYTAGYYLPGDLDYEEGDPASLPSALSDVAAEMVCERFYLAQRQNFGLASLKEGGVAYSFKDKNPSGTLSLGISDEHAAVLNEYKRFVIA